MRLQKDPHFLCMWLGNRPVIKEILAREMKFELNLEGEKEISGYIMGEELRLENQPACPNK